MVLETLALRECEVQDYANQMLVEALRDAEAYRVIAQESLELLHCYARDHERLRETHYRDAAEHRRLRESILLETV
jgi:hypothetical protein